MKKIIIWMFVSILLVISVFGLTINDAPEESDIVCANYDNTCDLFDDASINTSWWANTGTGVETGGYLEHNGARNSQFGTVGNYNEDHDWCIIYKYYWTATGQTLEGLDLDYDYDNGLSYESCIAYRTSTTALDQEITGKCNAAGYEPDGWNEVTTTNYTQRICYDNGTDELNYTVWEGTILNGTNKGTSNLGATEHYAWFEAGGNQRLLWFASWNGTVNDAPYTPLASPTITQNTYNCTTATLNQTVWRDNLSFNTYNKDNTPTITFDTDIAANCAVSTNHGLGDVNFSSMVGATNRNCSGGQGTTSHTCTVISADALTEGFNNSIYASCQATTGEESVNSTSGALNAFQYYLMKGTTKDNSANNLANVTVGIVNQDTMVMEGNTTSNSTGGWSKYIISSGNYTVFAYLNTTLAPDVEIYVSVP